MEGNLANKIYDSLLGSLVQESGEYIRIINHPTFKDILWAVLSYHLKDQYYFDIDPHVSKEYDFVGIILKNRIHELNDHIEKAISGTDDPNRIHELKQLQKSTTRKFDGYVIACIARLNIYDYSKAPEKRIVTDIDSLVLKFNEDQMILEFHESKNTKKPENDAKKDLKKKFIKVLNSNSKGYRIQKVTGFGAKVIIKH